MGVVFLLYCSRARVLKVQRGAYKLVKQCRTSKSPTLSYVGDFPFYSPRWGPHLQLFSVVPLHRRGCKIVLVSRRGPLSRSGVGELDPGDLLAQGMILTIYLSGVSPWRCPILAQSGRRVHPVGHSGGLLRSCSPEPGFLTWGAILRSSVTRQCAW